MELSEEEKKVIEYIKNIKSWWWNNSPDRVYTINKNDIEQFDMIINQIEKKQKEIERLNEIINSRYYHDLKCRELEIEINKNWQDKIKKFIKDELPDDEIMECCGMYDVNGVRLREELEKLLEE